MKKELIKIIKISGIDVRELVLDIKIDGYIFNSIELIDDDDERIILHIFQGELDIETDWDDIPSKQQLEIINFLKPFVYN